MHFPDPFSLFKRGSQKPSLWVADAFDMAEGAGVAEDADQMYEGILGEIGLQGMQQMGNNVGVGAIAS